MSDAAPVAAAKKKASKPKKPSNHPKYCDMIKEAISNLKERGGSSRQAILKYIVKHFNVGKDEKVVNQHLKMALRAGAKNGSLKQAKGTGASGSFRLGETKVKKEKKPSKNKKPKIKKPKKAKTPKKADEKKKKAKSPKKKVAKPKKAKAPKAGKKAAKPKKPKSPKKKAAKPKKLAKKAAKK